MTQRDLTKERDDKCIPIVLEILSDLANTPDLHIGSEVTTDSANVYYSDYVQDKVLPILMRENIKIDDISYVFKLILQPITFISEKVHTTIDTREDEAIDLLFGKAKRDTTVNDIQDILVNQGAVPIEQSETFAISAKPVEKWTTKLLKLLKKI
jgi:hypothetical protein